MVNPTTVIDIALVLVGCGIGIPIGGFLQRSIHNSELTNNVNAKRNLAIASFAVAIAVIIVLEAWVTFG